MKGVFTSVEKMLSRVLRQGREVFMIQDVTVVFVPANIELSTGDIAVRFNHNRNLIG